LEALFPSRALYLPTYRRIERDLREIFPEFEEGYRAIRRANARATESSSHYVDLVNFGMEDVKENISNRTRQLRDYSLERYNNLSATYLRDVIRGKADQYKAKDIKHLKNEDIDEILKRVSETTLTDFDKKLIKARVRDIQGQRKADVQSNDKFLAHYFTRLVTVNNEITQQEEDIRAFINVCNAYLLPSKRMVYDESAFYISIVDEHEVEIDLSHLSSGEKQIVSIFSHLYLDTYTEQIVFIDEPELSLSVPWQKRFLPDLLASKKCSYIFAVTHSPFIFENSLSSNAVDLRRNTKTWSGGTSQ
jgi:hypothetical protein